MKLPSRVYSKTRALPSTKGICSSKAGYRTTCTATRHARHVFRARFRPRLPSEQSEASLFGEVVREIVETHAGLLQGPASQATGLPFWSSARSRKAPLWRIISRRPRGDTAPRCGYGAECESFSPRRCGYTFPDDTIVQLIWLPMLHAQVALNHKDALKAIEILQVSTPSSLGRPGLTHLSRRCVPPIFAVRPFWLLTEEAKPRGNFRKFSITEAS